MKETIKVNFKHINTIDMYNEMLDENSKVDKEAVIESIYSTYTALCTKGKVIIKKKGNTDGWMNFKYPFGETTSFYGIQECKRDVSPTDLQLKKQLLQAIKYYYDACIAPENPPNYKFKVFCLNSANFYSYVFVDEIEELIKDLIPLLKESNCSGSLTWKNKILRETIKSFNVKFKTTMFPKDSDFVEIFTEIYKHCN